MKQMRIFCLLAILSLSIGAFAQGGTKPAAPAASPAPQRKLRPRLQQLSHRWWIARSASMKRTWWRRRKPCRQTNSTFPASLKIPGSAYSDVRTFATLVKHTATANYRLWTNVTGEKMPENIKGPNGPDELKTKEQIIQFLKDSFAVGHRAAKTITAQNALEEIAWFRGTAPRMFVASAAVIHAADEYGQMIEYLRMNGIVPPASRGN